MIGETNLSDKQALNSLSAAGSSSRRVTSPFFQFFSLSKTEVEFVSLLQNCELVVNYCILFKCNTLE